ncbi:MAG: glycosyltransferase family 4 protein [Acidobacteriota bacterium]
MLELVLIIVALGASYTGVAVYRRWSEKKGIVDLPNERSSHVDPTPRGGGLVIAGVCLVGYLVATYLGGARVSWGYLAGGVVIVGISWLDDIRSVHSAVRLLFHTVAALLFVSDAGVLRTLEIPGIAVELTLGWIAPALTVLWIVWLVNAYNFMDGIDGIAGMQALIAGLGWALAAFSGSAPGVYYFALIIASSAFGFLLLNWQPAKIFMGDAGSAFLGYTFAVLPVLASGENSEASGRFALTAVVVVWFFVFDSVFTFLIRLVTGQRVWTPHREHLYQRLVRSGSSHSRVSVLYGILTTVLIAVFAIAAKVDGITAVLPLFVLTGLSAVLAFYVRRKNLLT